MGGGDGGGGGGVITLFLTGRAAQDFKNRRLQI